MGSTISFIVPKSSELRIFKKNKKQIQGFVKINTCQGEVGLEGRGSDGRFVIARCMALNGIFSPLVAEALAAREGLILASNEGLRHAYQVWDSLAKRYNVISENHIQELKDELYNVSKTSTIEAYIDKIQEIAQKLTATGCVIEDDEIVFRALQGLPKVFNGLRTAVRAMRTRGYKVTFDELVTMMKSEEAQLSKETSNLDVHNTVLVASHGNTSQNQNSRGLVPNMVQPQQQGYGTAYGRSENPSQQQFISENSQQQQQYFPSNNMRYNNNNRGKGGGRSRFHCDICGRTNHSTDYCYYKTGGSGSQWRGYGNAQPQGFASSQQYTTHQPAQPQFVMPQPLYTMPQPQFYPQMYGQQGFPVYHSVSQFSVPPRPNGGGVKPTVPGAPMMHSIVTNTSTPSAPPDMNQSNVHTTSAPPAFAGFADSTSSTPVSTSFNVPLTSFSDIEIPVSYNPISSSSSQSIGTSCNSSLTSDLNNLYSY
ncbi:hypothetical protein Vadar_029614 [Vaccinium darrowii]|uniref:Uncharacterized protein n=1 Tax=Vaccinium darrowii TaxID=229202 RepID=A0ACB7XL83_9ERIC|nr:hypothetical protein Vadar_029614 [Vaccinium darrowii]